MSRSRESLGSRLFDTDPEVVAVEKKLLHLKVHSFFFYGRHFTLILSVLTHSLPLLQKHEIEEANENHAEFGRVAGNPLSYGQTVQVRR